MQRDQRTGRWRRRAEHSRRDLLAGLLACGPFAAGAAAETPKTVRIGISESVVGNVNITDARAAMTVWMKRITQELRLEVRQSSQVFEGPEKLAAQIRRGELDTVAVSLLEYRRIAEWLDQRLVVVPVERAPLRYLLLVPSEGGTSRLAQLRGKRLITLQTPVTSLAPAWLITLVSGEEAGGPERFFGSITEEVKPARVMLPAFFGRADACLVTASSFATMCELNPQLGKKLSPLAVSPEIVPNLYAFHRDAPQFIKELVIQALKGLKSSPAGRQVLTLFQYDTLEARDGACLNDSLAMLAKADRLRRTVSPKTPEVRP